jgi:rSAM/selenodomain-associated transferase 1
MNRALLVIAKRPAAGQTKTRLSPPFSEEEAAKLYESFLQDMLDITRAVPDVTHFVNYWPTDAINYFKQLAPDFDLIPQRGETLGERLDNVLTHCLTHGFDQAVITNSDSPTLPGAYLRQAFELLDQADVVLGPCDDGGYYLIGLTHPQPRLLREVQMSTPTVARDTLALAAAEGLHAALLPSWYDVDTISELNRLTRELRVTCAQVAPHTRHFLQNFVDEKVLS